MKCRYCNGNVKRGQKSCPFCGSPVDWDVSEEFQEEQEMQNSSEDSSDGYNGGGRAMPKADQPREPKPKPPKPNNPKPNNPKPNNPKPNNPKPNNPKPVNKPVVDPDAINKAGRAIAVVLALVLVVGGGMLLMKIRSRRSAVVSQNQQPVQGQVDQNEYEEPVDEAENENAGGDTSEGNGGQQDNQQAGIVELGFLTSGSATYPLSPSSFVLTECPDGVYTMMYPKDFFNTGYYNLDEKTFYLSNDEEEIQMIITQEDAPISYDPVTCANYMFDEKSSMINFDSVVETVYTRQSESVSESGYARSIIAGQLANDPGHGMYILHVCDNESVYTFRIYYPLDQSITNGRGFDFSPLGYMLDCCYRGFSIGGSTYELRSYDLYMADDMGTKKE